MWRVNESQRTTLKLIPRGKYFPSAVTVTSGNKTFTGLGPTTLTVVTLTLTIHTIHTLSLLLLFLSDLLPSISVPFSFSSVSTPISPQVNIITHNERKRKTNKKDKNCSKIKPWKVLCFAFIDSKVALIWLLKFSNGSFCLHPLFFFLEIQTVRAFFSLVFFYTLLVSHGSSSKFKPFAQLNSLANFVEMICLFSLLLMNFIVAESLWVGFNFVNLAPLSFFSILFDIYKF